MGQGLAFGRDTPDGVQIGAERHTEWVLIKGLMAHSAKTGETSGVVGRKIEGLPQPSPYPRDRVEYEPNRGGWGENVGETHDQSRRPGTNCHPALQFARAQYDRDRNANAYYTRLAYYDLMSYILDWSNGLRVTPTNQHPFGQLKNLCALDPSQAGQGGSTWPAPEVPRTRNSRSSMKSGVSHLRYQHPREPQDGLNESRVSTHRMALRQSSVPGGYIAGVVYEDRNGDGFYTPGKGTRTPGSDWTFTNTASVRSPPAAPRSASHRTEGSYRSGPTRTPTTTAVIPAP